MSENQNSKTAIVAGATGLVGEQLINLLLSSPEYGKVIAVVRKPLAITHQKLEQKVIEFSQLLSELSDIKADHGFCCLGTTIKTAGSKENQHVIDHDYVVNFARAAYQAGASRFAVVSSIGASSSSGNFYLRTKGKMEVDLQQIPFEGLYILQPSFLLGDRKEFRSGEKFGIVLMKLLSPLMVGSLRKYRGVLASVVASSMIRVINSDEKNVQIIRSDKLFS